MISTDHLFLLLSYFQFSDFLHLFLRDLIADSQCVTAAEDLATKRQNQSLPSVRKLQGAFILLCGRPSEKRWSAGVGRQTDWSARGKYHVICCGEEDRYGECGPHLGRRLPLHSAQSHVPQVPVPTYTTPGNSCCHSCRYLDTGQCFGSVFI